MVDTSLRMVPLYSGKWGSLNQYCLAIYVVLLLATIVVVHHPWSSMTHTYLARVNRSSVCFYCLQYSGSFYFVYSRDSMLDMADPQTVVRIQTCGMCNADSMRFYVVERKRKEQKEKLGTANTKRGSTEKMEKFVC